MTLKEKYYAYVLDNQEAEAITFDILRDVTDRRGWRQEWDGFDSDIQESIIQTWIDIVQKQLSAIQ